MATESQWAKVHREPAMKGNRIKISSSAGGEFDCYLAIPDGGTKVPGVVLASAIHGVDADLCAIADEFAEHGYIAAAPDLFWRSVPGPLERNDPRLSSRGQPRLEKIHAGEMDLRDTLAALRLHPKSNRRAVAMGFCYGGPYAILGPAKLGFDAGVGCHSTQMKDYIDELAGLTKPVCLLWGDQDTAAPPDVLESFREAAARIPSLEIHVFPGILHGYMMPHGTKAFDPPTRDFSMARVLKILQAMK